MPFLAGIPRGIPSPSGGTDRDLREPGGNLWLSDTRSTRAASGRGKRASAQARNGASRERANGADGAGPARASSSSSSPRSRPRATATSGSGCRSRGKGIAAELHRAFNELADRREAFSKEVARVGRAIGREGRLTERAHAPALAGHWADTTNALNTLIDDLVRPTTEVARVIDAVADGDLSQKMQLTIEGQPVKGEFRRIGTTVNAMVDQLSSFADEVTRVAREVGTDGKLGGQAKVKGVCGVWKDLTDNVNTLAGEPDDAGAQHRRGHDRGRERRPVEEDHRRRARRGRRAEEHDQHDGRPALLVRRRGHARRARGRRGGQARRPGAGQGRQRHVEGPDRVGERARVEPDDAGAEHRAVTTAVANGDLSKKITVDVKGEVLELKETVNTMVDQLRAFSPR